MMQLNSWCLADGNANVKDPNLWPALGSEHDPPLPAAFWRRHKLPGYGAPTPKILSAEFTSSGREIVVIFDSATMMGIVPVDINDDGIPDQHDPSTAWPRFF